MVVFISLGSQVVRDAKSTSNSLDACPGRGLKIRPASSSVFCNDGSPVSGVLDKLFRELFVLFFQITKSFCFYDITIFN